MNKLNLLFLNKKIIYDNNFDMDIICRKTQCQFNDNYTCRSENLNISENIICKSFILDKNKKLVDKSKNIFDKTPEYASHRPSRFANIKCQARCLFNNNCECEANGITVNCIKNKPYCITFLKK